MPQCVLRRPTPEGGVHLLAEDITTTTIETMSLREMGPQLKLPINVMKGSVPLQCNTYFPQILAI